MDYDKLIAPAAREMRPSGIRKFFDLAADMPECISLGVGEPDFKTPWAVREAGIESLEHGRTRYTSNAGLKELRAEISRYLERRMGLRYDPMRQILVTVGGSLLMERFFSVPGMGPLLTDAIQRYDLNVVQTLVILYAVLGIVGVFLGDVLMMVVDPRITLTGKEEAR